MSNYRTCSNGNSIATGCLLCVCRIGHNILLLPQHAPDLCAKGNIRLISIIFLV